MSNYGKKPPGRPRSVKPNASLVDAIDAEATLLLTEAKSDVVKLSLEERLLIFDKVAKWVGIRDKIMEGGSDDDDGSGLGGYKSTLKGEEGNAGGNARARPRGTATERLAAAVARDGSGSDIPIGSGIAELKGSLPHADDGGADGNSENSGGAFTVGTVNRRGVRVGAPDGEVPRPSDAPAVSDL